MSTLRTLRRGRRRPSQAAAPAPAPPTPLAPVAHPVTAVARCLLYAIRGRISELSSVEREFLLGASKAGLLPHEHEGCWHELARQHPETSQARADEKQSARIARWKKERREREAKANSKG